MDRRSFLSSALLAAPPSTGCDLLVQGAVDTELGPLLAALQAKKEHRLEAWTYWSGRLGRQRVVISRTDVGPVNAAASTALGVREFRPALVLNQGTAGGHNRKLKLWDIILGAKTVDYSAFKSDHGDSGSGVQLNRWKPMPHKIRVGAGDAISFPAFAGDSELIAKARQIKYTRGTIHTGNIGSAYQFHKELDLIDWFHRTFGTDSEDMESAYCAGVAVGMHTRFLAIRIISDTEWEHPVFERIAGQYCAEFVTDLIRSL